MTAKKISLALVFTGLILGATFAIFSSAASAATCGQLASGATMTPGQSIRSCNGKYTLLFQTDGNVVLYPTNRIDAAHAYWATPTGGGTFVMQTEGNLVLYKAGVPQSVENALWASNLDGGTYGRSGYLVVQDDGNLVVFATVGGAVMWQSKTNFSHRLAMDDRSGNYPPATTGARFDDYMSMGIGDMFFDFEWRWLEFSEGQWADNANYRGYMQMAVDRGMGLKILLDTINAPPQWFLNKYPDARIVDQEGKYSTNMVSYWYAGIRPLMEQKTDYLFNQLKQWGFLDNANYIGIPLGPASEPIYPAAWTTLSSYESFWWYAPNAQADFVLKMQAKYGTISAANTAWSTSYAGWSSVSIPAVGTKTGPMWNDVLLWYRDTKRNFIDWQIQNYKRALAKYADPAHRPQLIIFVPCDPSYISAADWDAAVATGGGGVSVKLMCDSEYLIEEAHKYGLHLEYTGLPADHVIAGLKSRMQARGMVSPLQGENVGGYFHSDADLDANYLSIVRGNLYAFDFVAFGSLLYASDGVTKTSQYQGVARLFQRLRTFYNTNQILTPPPPASTALIKGKRVTMPGNVTDTVAQTVTVTGGSSSAANPYSFTVNAGSTYTVSVPARAGYTIGYTRCIDSTTCHSQTPTTGTSATVIILAGTGHYADLWWHYTPIPTIQPVTGFVDGVITPANTVNGWACQKKNTASISVHLYVGGPAGTGTFIGSYLANKASAPAVATECQSTGTTYRYSIPLSATTITQHAGKLIYVYGVNPTPGGTNALLTKSGTFRVPTPIPAPTATITQNKNTTTSDGTTGQTFTISWGSTNATSCVVQKSGPGGAITNPWATGTSGSRDAVPAPIGTHRWWVDCTGPSGTAHAELNHSVIAATSCGILATGSSLTPGQSIKSCDGVYTLIFQGDGNVVLYPSAHIDSRYAIWATGTYGYAAAVLVMQGDGNLVLYKAGVQSNATALWASGSIPPTWKTGGGTFGKPGYLAVQGDGNLVVYATADNSVMWASNTVQSSAAPALTPFTHTLALGWTGDEVLALQTSLTQLGFYQGEITGYFGPVTEAAVRELQLQNNLAAVGIVGPLTRSLLQRLLGY